MMDYFRKYLPLLGLLIAALVPSACAAAQVPRTRDEVPRITVEELKERMDSGATIVVGDTRSQEEYDTRHIPGAISIPLSEIEGRLEDIPQDQEIVLYCT